MLGRLDGGVGLEHLAVRPDQHRFPRRLLGARFGDAVGRGHRSVQVAQQIVRKLKLLLELLVRLDRVETDADDDGVAVVEILDSITEPLAFDRSPGCIGFRIPPEKNILPGVLREIDRRSVLIRQAEPRRGRANVDECHNAPLGSSRCG